MKLLVCGGRTFTDVEYAIPRIHRVHLDTPVSLLISGRARGGDTLGEAWANEVGVPILGFPITKEDWSKHGRAAGPIRNRQMLIEGKPDAVLALPGGNGTRDMCQIAREAGIEPIEYRYEFFRKEDIVLGFLSNFYASDQVDPSDGLVYPSNEHYYQCEKTIDPAYRQWIYEAPDALTAKRRGSSKTLPFRPDWNTYKLEAMMNGLRMKFPDRSSLSDRLIHAGDNYLVEYAPWGDTFWGVDKQHKGHNWLGRLIMRRRDEILTGQRYA